MATYKEIKGVTVQTRDEDPTVNVGSWSSGGAINSARNFASGQGSNTASIIFGGSPAGKVITEQYDGASWTEVGDLGTARYSMPSFGASYT